MGGKHKQANRTKNNARPSSSSHTAELLGNTIPAYFGLSAVKDGTTIMPGFSSDDFDYNIDSNFQLVLKKMNKKDSTTKLKALQEFTDLCKNSEIDAVKTVLPFWPRLYCLLCTDIEHRVREASHNAHRAVISKVKKSIAPYLKQIAGPWFTSQYDTYPPAASAATLAFQEAFPPAKLNEAIVFCQEEILSYIHDNLMNQTAQTLSTPKTSPEEMEAKYQRVIIASLQGYSLYLQRLSTEQIKQAEKTNKKILTSQKFWKYSKHKAPAIRNSFFNALISLCQNAKFLLDAESAHVSAAIFNNLDESDPMVLPTVWDAALNVLVVIEDCWAHVNLEKQVFPKLYVILRDGGRGNGTTIFPNILPLLSKLPSDMIRDKNLFYGNLFDNMKLGLEVASVNQSHSEGKIIATTFIECLKYIIMCNCKDLELCKGLISNNLIRAIEEKITSPNALNKTVTIPLFSQVCGLMRYWHRNRRADGLEYEPILIYFLDLLIELFDRTVTQEVAETTITTVLNNQMEFLTVCKNPNKSTKIKGRVKFAEEKNSPEENNESKNEPDDEEFIKELLTIAKKIAATYLKNTIKNNTNVYLPFLNKLVQTFDSKIIFEELLRVLEEDSIFKLYSSLFSKWMDEPTMRTADVIELSFNLLLDVHQNEKEIILKDFNEKWFNETLQYDICRILLKYSNDGCVKAWVRSENFGDSILDLTKKFVSGSKDIPVSRDVIVQFFKSKSSNEELIIGSETANSIINIVSENIRRSGRKKHVNKLAQDLVLQTSEHVYPSSFYGLVSSLFKLSCYTTDNEKLLSACKTGLRSILYAARCKNLESDFTEKLAEVVREIVFSEDIPFQLEHIVSLINTYVDLAVNNNLSEGISSNLDIEEAIGIIQIFLKDTPEIKRWRQLIIRSCKLGYQNRGDWDLKFLEVEESEKENLFKNVSLNEMTENLVQSLADEYDSSETLKFMNFSLENLEKILKYRRCFDYYNVVKEKENDFISVDLIKKYAKWNLFVGSLLKLIVSAHPRSYKNYLLQEINVYCTSEEALTSWKDTNKHSDFIPIKITVEEKEEMEQDLKIIENDFSDAEYQDKNNIIPICNHVFDFVLSVGLLNSFNQFYSSTKYYKSLQEPLKKLKSLADDVFRNANPLESLFCYYSIKYFAVKESEWRMVLPTLKEIFHRNFLEEKFEITLEDIEKFIETEVSNKILTVNALLKTWYIAANYSERLTEEQWHQIFIFIDVFFRNMKDGDEFLDKNMPLLSAISRLQLQLIKSFKENHLRPMDERISPEACLAWNEVVKSELFYKYFSIWLKLTEKYYGEKEIKTECIAVLENISQIVLSDLSLKKYNEEESIEFLKQFGRYITSPHAVFQISSFKMLLSLVPDLVKLDTNLFCNNISQVSTDTKEGSSLFKKNAGCDWTCKNLEEFIVSNQAIVETLLSDFIIGDCCTVEPFTDSYSYTYSYLLLWCFVLEICGEAHSPLRFQYGCWLNEKGYSTCFLESVFKLMPQSVLQGFEAKENCTKYFENHASLDFVEPVKSERIEQTACYAYKMILQRLPNVVRNWWSQAENKTSVLVDKVTSLYVSPILISNELKSVQQDQENGFENVEIKTHLNAREVIATYTIDEVKMDLMMTLPQNHPLSPIKIDPSNVVVSSSNWRNLQFLISKYLINQNGTIWGALVIWKNYLDKKFEGVEECYICFSILQGVTYDIPKLSCHTCRKKFHSQCLFKWFSTSNKSTCPICRNLF